MKTTTYIVAASVAGLVFGGGWLGQKLWRSAKDIVSIEARGMPLSELVRKMERQTGESIAVDSNLNTKVTLSLKNVPLGRALQEVARKVGALGGSIHAVYLRDADLAALKADLERGTSPSTAKWTNLAPRLDPGESPMLAERRGFREKGALPPGAKMVTREVRLTGPPGAAAGGKAGPHGGDDSASPVVMRVSTSDGAGNVETEVWPTERLILQNSLAVRLPATTTAAATRESAREIARQTKGHYATVYALKRSPGGADILTSGPGPMRHTAKDDAGDRKAPGSDIEARVQRDKLARFVDLTPEQRAQRVKEGLPRNN